MISLSNGMLLNSIEPLSVWRAIIYAFSFPLKLEHFMEPILSFNICKVFPDNVIQYTEKNNSTNSFVSTLE